MCRPYILGRKSGLIHSLPRSGACRGSPGRKSRQTPVRPESGATLRGRTVSTTRAVRALLRRPSPCPRSKCRPRGPSAPWPGGRFAGSQELQGLDKEAPHRCQVMSRYFVTKGLPSIGNSILRKMRRASRCPSKRVQALSANDCSIWRRIKAADMQLNGSVQNMSTQISQSRWEQAQQWELAHWRRESRGLRAWLRRLRGRGGDDWNHWWAARFDNYRFIPQELDNVIELGCGPYTNVRLIVEDRSVRHLVCSDPLVLHYCALPGSWIRRAVRSGNLSLDDHAIENAPFKEKYFDLVIMINVLDHVQDAFRCLAAATSLVKPGGLLLLGQDLTAEEDDIEDVGHPIRLHLTDILPYLTNFEPVLQETLTRKQGRNPSVHYATLVFAGRRPQMAPVSD